MPSLELLDVIQHAKPDIREIDVSRTALSLKGASGSLNNYNMAIEHIDSYCSGYQKLPDLLDFLRTHPNPRWHKHLEDVGTRLWEIFGARPGKWRKVGRRPIESVGGLLIKPTIRGFWIFDGKAYPCLVNARSSVYLDAITNRKFVARGVYEFHVRDEIGVAGPAIVDLGREPSSKVRANRVYFPDEADMMSVEEFESIMIKFNQSLRLAGFNSRSVSSAIDMFRVRPSS